MHQFKNKIPSFREVQTLKNTNKNYLREATSYKSVKEI
nr:MAG TPA: hypothetical protein [Caudoviricetes sp.]